MKIKRNIAVSDTGFIFNPDTGESYTVNPIGASIIKQMQQGKAVDEITGALEKSYDIDLNTLEKDTEDFLGLLKNFSLIDNE
jgi:transcription elongation factor GreA-like protein